MGETGSEQFLNDFYAAYTSQDPVVIAGYLADDVEWRMNGPAELFPLCGHRRGKAAVIDLIARQRASVFRPRAREVGETVCDGNRIASFSKITCFHAETGRVIVFHSANFITLRAGKVATMHNIADTFSAAEQIFGHRIDAFQWHDSARAQSLAPSQDIIAI